MNSENCVTRDDFGAFFAELHHGHQPFPWQWRLLDEVLTTRRWPEALVAPTGSGKTSAIDVHVFALAVAAAEGGALPPRRLAMVVNRRVLVDDQYEHARALADRLAEPGDSSVLRAVAEQLWQVQGRADEHADSPGQAASPLLVARLRGGVPPSRRWADHPTAAAVLCATPDMFGSRLLFRGYGSSARSWPREAGLLAVDTAALIDEAHLSRQLLRTARRVGELVTLAERQWHGPSPLHVVETTATPDGAAGTWLGVDDADLAEEGTLRARLTRPKPVELVPVKQWAAPNPSAKVVGELAQRTVELADRGLGGTVGCFVNTVARAVDVAQRLRDMRDRDLTVVLICGQVRPVDLQRLENTYPGVLGPGGNSGVDVIVSTQSLEVGVDLDLAGIVTDLAAGSALAQRAGRVNRRGERDEGPVVVVVPDEGLRSDTRSGPYAGDDLIAAHEWIERRAAAPEGLAPWALRDDPPPGPRPRRRLLQRPEPGDAWHWARTSENLASDPELELWLAEDFDPDFNVGVVVRKLPADPTEAVELLSLLPPRRHETFSVPLGTAREAVAAAGNDGAYAIVVRGEQVAPLAWDRTEAGTDRPRIRPGDVVVVDEPTPMFTAPGRDGQEETPQVVTDSGGHPARDVLEDVAELSSELRPGEVVYRCELPRNEPGGDEVDEAAAELAGRLDVAADEPERDVDEAGVVLDWLDTHARGRMAEAARDLVRDGSRVEVVVQRDEDRIPRRVVVIDRRRAAADEYVRQEWTPNTDPVPLDEHQKAVGQRATELARLLGLPQDTCDVLREAAEHHDDGKADPRFQRRLGGDATTLLAKSAGTPARAALRRKQESSDLPMGWRHEQRSVVDAWPQLSPGHNRELVARLVGTTHGHGRAEFPHVAGELMSRDDSDAARALATALFDEGDWPQLIERTERRYGVWICAYLEAVLRATDGQISAEGR
ncbi:type I-G CRISPR-associated helicase/endonuclease Cas3g [Prauserella aidingensis]|uniref:type I-G CRISPR-associated helicase/endonuclease Cas3g n=1 Tax=Prauserella aidingensis TaxID=387890 RepID=UPI0020A43DD3|nr:type I-U CRISPR-associated helicase/endonuclease Cas3 [Prauserella aidingensis]